MRYNEQAPLRRRTPRVKPFSILGRIALLWASLSGAPALAASSRLGLFVEPRDGVAPVLAAIGSARRSIDLEVYLITDRQVLGALEGAARRGVRVRVILEPHPFGGGERYARRAHDELARHGCQVRWSDPAFTYTHEKALVIDGREALIMTCNLSASAFRRNREYGLVDRDPQDVGAVETLFEGDWRDRPRTVNDAALVVAPQDARGDLLSLIGSARRQILIQDEEIVDPAAIAELGRKAASGIQVRVELPGGRRLSSRALAAVDLLHQAGIAQVRLMTRHYLHAKLIVVDGVRAYVGSVNLSANSLDRNREVGRLLSDPRIVDRLRQVFVADWTAGREP